MAKQFTDESRKLLYKNLNKRIDNAEIEIKKITHYPEAPKDGNKEPEGYVAELAGQVRPQKELSKKNTEDINYLETRIKHFQLSLRLAFNTEWIIEQRKEMISDTAKIIREEFGPGADMTDDKKAAEPIHYARLNALTKAVKCNKKGCYTGRGFTGWSQSTGEAILCTCTTDTINYYKLHD